MPSEKVSRAVFSDSIVSAKYRHISIRLAGSDFKIWDITGGYLGYIYCEEVVFIADGAEGTVFTWDELKEITKVIGKIRKWTLS